MRKAMRSMTDTSVVVCTYTEDRWHDLVAAIESVQRQTRRPGEIVVVVDHNPSLLSRIRASFAHPVVENTGERGLSGARNSGIAAARGSEIVFLDDDAVAEPDWLDLLVARRRDAQVLGAGGALEPLWQHKRPQWFPDEFDWVVGCSYRGMPTETTVVRNPLGGSMWIRREVFDAIGGFRSGIGRHGTRPLGCEETELCIRARQRWPDRCFVYEPSARVHHRVPAVRARWSYLTARCFAEGVSKAHVTRFVGARDGLAAERAYVLNTLPRGVARGIQDTLTRGDATGLARAASIIVGVLVAAAGYLVGRWSRLPGGQQAGLAPGRAALHNAGR
ncbi:MAG: glycosyltransferase [Chloroflexi bacterium]|nr:glycosyltransferase [Chloroflexota bacterium]